MTNRRQFLMAAALTSVPLSVGTFARADRKPVDNRAPIALHAVLIDERHAESRAFGARLAGRVPQVHDVPDGDVTQLWLQQIGPAWRRQPVAVAGMTAPSVLFCLEQLAWSSGLRVVFHAEHVLVPSSAPRHAVLRGGAAAGLEAHDLEYLGPLWPGRLAEGVAAHRAAASAGRVGPSVAGLEPAVPPGGQVLTSWIIAAA